MEHSPYASAVTRPFEVYNSIFLTLPLDGIRGTGLRVPLFAEACREGLAEGRSPIDLLAGTGAPAGKSAGIVVSIRSVYRAAGGAVDAWRMRGMTA